MEKVYIWFLTQTVCVSLGVVTTGVCAKPVFAAITNSLSVGWGRSCACAALQISRRVLEQLARCSAVHAAQRRGGVAAHIYPPMSQWQVLRLGLNRLLYLLWALHTLRTPVVTNSVPALMTHLLLLLQRHFDGWLPGIRRALFWPPSPLLGDDNFWFPGKCDSSSPNVLKCFMCQSLLGAVDPYLGGNS